MSLPVVPELIDLLTTEDYLKWLRRGLIAEFNNVASGNVDGTTIQGVSTQIERSDAPVVFEAETVILTLTQSNVGSQTLLLAHLLSVTVANTLTLRLRKDSISGTVLSSRQISTAVSTLVPIPLMGIDTNPAASQVYVLTIQSSSGAESVSGRELVGMALATGTLGAGSTEANTASNVNVAGVGVFKQKTGVNLEFRGINAGSSRATVGLDGANNEIDVDVSDPLTLGTLTITSALSLSEGVNVALGTVTGTKLAATTIQKLGIWGATPIVQPLVTADLLDSLQAAGLVAAGAGNTPLDLTQGAVVHGTLTTDAITMRDAQNIILNATTGTKIGTATTQKLGFFNATPVAQPAGTTDVLASLVTLGLRAASVNPPLDLGTGALTAGPSTLSATTVTTLGTAGLVTLADGNNIAVGSTTGTKLGTAITQKLSLWGVTPVTQPASANQAALIDSTTGTADGTVVDVGTSFSQATLNNNFADIIRLVNQLRTDLVSVGAIKGAV